MRLPIFRSTNKSYIPDSTSSGRNSVAEQAGRPLSSALSKPASEGAAHFLNPAVPHDFDPLFEFQDLRELPGIQTESIQPSLDQNDALRLSPKNRASSHISIERNMSHGSDQIPSSSPLPSYYGSTEQAEGYSDAAEPLDIPRTSARLSSVSHKLHWPLNMLPRTSLGSNEPLNFAGSPPRTSPVRLNDESLEHSYSFPQQSDRILEEDELDYGDTPLNQSLQDSPSLGAAQRSRERMVKPANTPSFPFDGAAQSSPDTDKTPDKNPSVQQLLRRSTDRVSRAQVSAPRVEQHAAKGEFVSSSGNSDFVSAIENSRFSTMETPDSPAREYSASIAGSSVSNSRFEPSRGSLKSFHVNRADESEQAYKRQPFQTSMSAFSTDEFADDRFQGTQPDGVSSLQTSSDLETHSTQSNIIATSTRSDEAVPGAPEPAPDLLSSTVSLRPSYLQDLNQTYASSETLSRLPKLRVIDDQHIFSSSQSAATAHPSAPREEQVENSILESTAFYTASSFNSSIVNGRPAENGPRRNTDEPYGVLREELQPIGGAPQDEFNLTNPSISRQTSSEEQPTLNSRYVSFGSSIFTGLDDSPEDTKKGAEFVLRPGSTPTKGQRNEKYKSLNNGLGLSRSSLEFSRLPSYASNMTSFTDQTQTGSPERRRRSLSPLPLPSSESNVEQAGMLDESLLATPKAKLRDEAPTDTVLARHVRDIEVPKTVAREYRAMYMPDSEADSPRYSPGKASLTLKEQNSKMDKLSKENFDLKLKIHYLHQALQDRSDEGVKDLITKNAQLQTDLIKAKKEIQSLRKRIRELERLSRDRGEDISASQSTILGSETDASTRSYRQAQLEDEVLYLRNRIQALDQENQYLKDDGLDLRPGNDDSSRHHLKEEIAHRKELENELHAMREENSRLRDSRAESRSFTNGSQWRSQFSGSSDGHNGSLSGSTMVEQLRQENADLRRDLGAQTSMLSSRNREKERLQQEIEDLKIFQRRNSSQPSISGGDSLLDRSVSRANHTPGSRGGGLTRNNHFSDAEREQHETLQAELRDDNAALRMRIQELQRVEPRPSSNDEALEAMQAERDAALLDVETIEAEAKQELDAAGKEIDELDAMILQKEEDIQQLSADLQHREQESDRMQREVRVITERMNRVIDECEISQTTIENLQEEINDMSHELEAMDKKMYELKSEKERVEVQHESSQNEIAFLRDEQETDKMKIGDLESALRAAHGSVQGGAFRQQQFEELQASAIKAREEVRQLRSKLSMTERVAMISKNNLNSVGVSLRQIFASGEEVPTLLSRVVRLKHDLEHNIQVVANLEQQSSDKTRLVQQRDALLESSAMESRRLADALEKERQARKHDQNEFEKSQRTPGTPEKRFAELERLRNQEKKHFANVEQKLNGQLHEANSILIKLWTELIKLCGKDWEQRRGIERPSPDSISANPTTFVANVHAALSTIASNFGGLHSRIRSTEQDLLKSLSALSRTLDARTKRIETLERNFADHAKDSTETQEQALAELSRLEDENKTLGAALAQARTALASSRSATRPMSTASTASDPQDVARQRSSSSSAALLLRRGDSATSTAAVRQSLDGATAQAAHQDTPTAAAAAAAAYSRAADQRWVLRLQEMEARLHKEREGRLLDREGARKRLDDGRRENEALKGELSRQRDRGGAVSKAVGRSEGSVD